MLLLFLLMDREDGPFGWEQLDLSLLPCPGGFSRQLDDPGGWVLTWSLGAVKGPSDPTDEHGDEASSRRRSSSAAAAGPVSWDQTRVFLCSTGLEKDTFSFRVVLHCRSPGAPAPPQAYPLHCQPWEGVHSTRDPKSRNSGDMDLVSGPGNSNSHRPFSYRSGISTTSVFCRLASWLWKGYGCVLTTLSNFSLALVIIINASCYSKYPAKPSVLIHVCSSFAQTTESWMVPMVALLQAVTQGSLCGLAI